MTIKKAENLIQHFDQTIFDNLSEELKTHWKSYDEIQQTEILRSLYNAALNNNLTSQLSTNFQDIAPTIINSLYYETLPRRHEIPFINTEKNSESLLETYDKDKFINVAKALNELSRNLSDHPKNIADIQIRTLINLIKSARSAQDMDILRKIIKLSYRPTKAVLLYYIKDIQFGNPVAMKFVAIYALSGHYRPYKISIPWAIEYLENHLTENHPNQNLKKERNELNEAKKRIANLGEDEEIPEYGSEKFEEVVKKTIENLETNDYIRCSTHIDSFELSRDLFKEQAQERTKDFVEETTASTEEAPASTEEAPANKIYNEWKKTYAKNFPALDSNLKENLLDSTNILKSGLEFTNENKSEIIRSMQAAINGLSRWYYSTKDGKKELLEEAKKRFDDDPCSRNLQIFLAICQAHRTSRENSLFHHAKTSSFSAFKKALPEELKKQMFNEEPKQNLFNIWGKK
ncbi:MAG: hypothetical protein QG594_786 [Bacteroidota bacterium]|nr:hypothetical protein [Bacteroidota bacterium]